MVRGWQHCYDIECRHSVLRCADAALIVVRGVGHVHLVGVLWQHFVQSYHTVFLVLGNIFFGSWDINIHLSFNSNAVMWMSQCV